MNEQSNAIYDFVSGATMLGFFVAALFFLRFLKRTRDRLFLYFTVAFAMLGVQRAALLLDAQVDENSAALYYGLRLLAFVLIIFAIVEKNRGPRPRAASGTSRDGGGAAKKAGNLAAPDDRFEGKNGTDETAPPRDGEVPAMRR